MLPEFKIVQLRHFVWVAELKGFHAAAEKAHRTQPAISLSVRDLENKLNESLFEKRNNRSTKPELTPFGQQFLPKAKELIAFHDRIAKDMMLLSEHKTGHLRLASVPSIASRFLPELLLKFVGDSKLHVSVFDDNSEAVLKMVENKQVDFGLASLFEEHTHKDVHFTPIWQDHVGVVCRFDHPLAEKKLLDWQALRDYPLVGNGTSRLLAGSEAEILLESSQYYISNMISLVAMLETGLGITTLPWYAFPRDNKQLTFVPLHTPNIARRIGIIRLSHTTMSPPAQGLIDFIMANQEV